jgi:hypothetical protein
MKIDPSFTEGFLDGLGAGLFTRLRRPGAPDELIDSRPLEESSDDYSEVVASFREAEEELRENQKRRQQAQYVDGHPEAVNALPPLPAGRTTSDGRLTETIRKVLGRNRKHA